MSNTIYNDKIKVNCPLFHDENGYYHLIYKIVNTVNRKVYIGKHSTKDPYDGYFGSGKAIKSAIEKYKPENFIKEILFCFDKENDAFLKEEELVTQEFVDRDDTYNIAIGGKGFTSECIKGKNNPMYGKKHTQESKDKMSKAKKGKYTGKNHPMYGRRGENNPRYGKKHKPDTLKKMSEAQRGEKNPMYGRRGIDCPNYGENNPMYGKPGTMLGKKHKQSSKDKMSQNHADFSDAKNPNAKAVLKIDEFGNIAAEYGCIKDCSMQENINRGKLNKIIKEHILYNGFYFEFKPKK